VRGVSAADRQPAKSPAERKRDQRARERELHAAGLVRLCITVPEIEISDYLRRMSFLDPNEEDDAEAIARGVEALLRLLIDTADDASMSP
jgi:hypothetical protein